MSLIHTPPARKIITPQGWSRRKFIGACGLILAPTIVRAQPFTLNDPAFLAGAKAASGGGGGGCATGRDSIATGGASAVGLGKFSFTHFLATKITPSATFTICSFNANLAKVGSPTGNLKGFIYSDSSNKPGTSGAGNLMSGGTSSVVAVSSVPSSAGSVNFPGLSASAVNGTPIWVVIWESFADDGTNYINWGPGPVGGSANTYDAPDAGGGVPGSWTQWDIIGCMCQLFSA